MDESILKRRFGEFSTSGAFILIKLQNAETREIMDIVCENISWAFICKDNLKLISESKEYTGYMVKNYNKMFEIGNDIYSKLKGAEAGNSYMEYSQLPWQNIKEKFLEKERGFYNIKDRNLEMNADFIKMLLHHNVVVRRDCYDGSVYVQE